MLPVLETYTSFHPDIGHVEIHNVPMFKCTGCGERVIGDEGNLIIDNWFESRLPRRRFEKPMSRRKAGAVNAPILWTLLASIAATLFMLSTCSKSLKAAPQLAEFDPAMQQTPEQKRFDITYSQVNGGASLYVFRDYNTGKEYLMVTYNNTSTFTPLE